MRKTKIPALSIVLYAIAGTLVLYAIWSVSHSVRYISELITTGQLPVKGNEYDIVNFYMANSAQYALFAVILFTLGWMLQRISLHKMPRLYKNINPSSGEAAEKELILGMSVPNSTRI